MKEGKHAKKFFKIIEAYSVLIFIVTLFMSIGYAKISGTIINITGTVEANAQEGVFIANITKNSGETTESKINYYIGTMFESEIVLSDIENGSETYEITFYNNSECEYVYLGTLTDIEDGKLYDNENIEFIVSGIEQYKTIISPAQSLKCTITFKYKDGTNRENNILNSKINFRFKEMPKLALSNEGQIYTLNDMYPDHEPQRYEFTVSNYKEEVINNIPIDYLFDIKIDKPLNAKIYDENDNEVTSSISFEGNEKIEHRYTLEIVWDDSNEEENVKYDASKYEEKQFLCQVKLIAQTDDEKYLNFFIEKEFNININSSDYKESYIISYIDITNFNYPTEIAQGEDFEIIFIKEIPPIIEVTGAESYIYNKPKLIINNATTDIKIKNPTGELIAYEYAMDYVFTGNNYINTETALFSEANAKRNFRISFEIIADDLTQTGYNTLVAALNEAGKPDYPGFLFRVGESKRLTEFEFTANNISGKGKVYFSEREITTKVEILRIDNILYLRLNDGEYIEMQDYTEFSNYFDVPLTIGAGLNSGGVPFRYFKGTLSNIEFKFLTESALSVKSAINPSIDNTYMVPVKYENNQCIELESIENEEWFDYSEQKWANVRTDNGYFVYIPRYAYKITSGYHTTLSSAGTIAIVFLNEDNTLKTIKDSEGNIVNPNDIVTADQVNSNEANTGINATTKYIIHPAFTAFDDNGKNIDGIWVAKYEMSMESLSSNETTWSHVSIESENNGNISIISDKTKRMVSKPGASSWRYIDVTNIFDNCYYMNRNLDSHMMKNTEWGAVAYLGMSKYGKGADNEIESNKSESYLTGYGASGTLSAGAASTTGNMYGVFDMAGGSHEYVAGYVNDTCLDVGGSLYLANQSLVLAEEKYKDVYKVGANNTSEECYIANSIRVGDALWEVSSDINNLAWYDDEFDFSGLSIYDNGHYPVFDRGGDYGSWTLNTGVNYAGRNNGAGHIRVSFRAVICVK